LNALDQANPKTEHATSRHSPFKPLGLQGLEDLSPVLLAALATDEPLLGARTPQGPRWYWSIYGLNLRGPLPAGVVVQGLADDLAAAGAAFKENWEKVLGAGSVKP